MKVENRVENITFFDQSMNCETQFGVPCWVLGDERYILTITSWAFFFFLTSRCTVNHWLEPSSCLAWFQAWNCFQDHFIAAGEGFFGEAKRELLCTETVQRSWKNCIWWLRWEREKRNIRWMVVKLSHWPSTESTC